MTPLHYRARSLWRQSLSLLRLFEDEQFLEPFGLTHANTTKELDDLCDRVERLHAKLRQISETGGRPHV